MTIDFKTTACLEGEGQTEMTVTQAEQPWSGRLLFPAAALPLLWCLLLLLLRVVVLLWVCRPFLTGISSYSLSLSTPLSVRSAKGKNGAFSYKNYVSNKLYQWRRFFSGNSLGEWDFFDNNNGAYFRPLFPRWWGKGWRMPVYCTNDAQATRLNSFFCLWRIIILLRCSIQYYANKQRTPPPFRVSVRETVFEPGTGTSTFSSLVQWATTFGQR